MNKQNLSVFNKHQLSIAKKTLKMNDVGVLVMGRMTKEDARIIIKKITGRDAKE